MLTTNNQSQALQAVFIDRDGTIGGNGHFIHPQNFQPFPNSLDAIEILKENGSKVFAFTNQHRISRAEAEEADFIKEFQSFGFDSSYICPHEQTNGCDCRKPKPGLLIKAAKEHGLDLTRCVVIGDVGSNDMLAAAAVGAFKILVKTGWGMQSLNAYRNTWYDKAEPDYIADNLYEAATWLVKRSIFTG